MLQVKNQNKLFYTGILIVLVLAALGIGYAAGILHKEKLQKELDISNFINVVFSSGTMANAMFNSENYVQAKQAYLQAKTALIHGSDLRSIKVNDNIILSYYLAVINYRLAIIETKLGNSELAESYRDDYTNALDELNLKFQNQKEAREHLEWTGKCLGVLPSDMRQ